MTPEEQQLFQSKEMQEASLPNEEQLSNEDQSIESAAFDTLKMFEKDHDMFLNQDISKDLPEEVLGRIAGFLEDRVKEDSKQQEKWLNSINLIKPYLGFSLDRVFNKGKDSSIVGNLTSSGVCDSTLATSLLRLWAIIRSEILPTEGPVGFKIILDDTESSDVMGGVVKDALNEYLTVEDKGFYPDFDRFLLYLLLYGCVFRKIFIHPILKKPVSRFILPEDFLIENNCSSITESSRQTHIRYLNKYEIASNIRSGIFRSNVELNYLKNNISALEITNNSDYSFDSNLADTETATNSNSFKFYETYESLSISDFLNPISSYSFDINEQSTPVPYIITRCATTNKIVSLIPNWSETDPDKKKINHFIHYNLFPGFDIYGLGLGQILGSNAITLTEIQRISIDAAIFQIFPGGIRAQGIKVQDDNITVKPGQFVALDTGGLALQEAIMPLPYNGPSQALMELGERIKSASADIASTAEIGMPQESANTPVGTTVAMLEVANRMQSAILKTIHNSFSDEIELLFSSFYSKEEIDKFTGFKVIPISDPSVESTTMRIMKAENLLKVAQSAPELHDMRSVYERLYAALGVEDIDKILRPETQEQQEQPMDPQLQVQMADTDQRRLEVESRERIAMLQMENDGYKTQMGIELDKQKLENDRYVADLKAQMQAEFERIKLDIEKEKIDLEKAKLESDGYKTQIKLELDRAKLEEAKDQEDANLQIQLLKEQKDARITELENLVDELKLQLQVTTPDLI